MNRRLGYVTVGIALGVAVMAAVNVARVELNVPQRDGRPATYDHLGLFAAIGAVTGGVIGLYYGRRTPA